MIKIIKEINKVNDKSYTNYKLLITINDKVHSVAIQPKTFGKDWTHPSVRHSFTLLDLVSELKIKENDK